MGRGKGEPVVPGLRDIPAWKVRAGAGGGGVSGKSAGEDLDWDPDVAVEAEEEELAQAELDATDSLFTEEEFQQWTSRQAVLWIANAANAFEVLGFRAKPLDCSGAARRRYKRLSLLTHPDKTQDADAGPAFQKLNHAMRILTDDEKQRHLLRVLFPREYGGMSEGERQLISEGGVGLYNTGAREQAKKEQRAHNDLESKLKEALKESEQLKTADKEAAERMKKRGALATLAPSATAFSMGDAGEAKRLRRAMAAEAEASGKNLWGLPEAFQPPLPEAPGAAASASSSAGAGAASGEDADPNALWEQAGALGLAANGWQRQESRSQPGRFYFLHMKTGKRVLDACVQKALGLPPGWERRESRSKPGVFYYANPATGETSMEPPSAASSPASAQAWPQHCAPPQQLLQQQQPQAGVQAWSQFQAQLQELLHEQPPAARQGWPQPLAPLRPPAPQQRAPAQQPAQQGAAGRQLWPWELVPDAPADAGEAQDANPRDRNSRERHFQGNDLWPLVQDFIRTSGVDGSASQALMAAPLHIQRRIIDGQSLEGCSNPSAVLMANLRRMLGGGKGNGSFQRG